MEICPGCMDEEIPEGQGYCERCLDGPAGPYLIDALLQRQQEEEREAEEIIEAERRSALAKEERAGRTEGAPRLTVRHGVSGSVLCEVAVAPETTLEDLRHSVERGTGIPVTAQRLLHGVEELTNPHRYVQWLTQEGPAELTLVQRTAHEAWAERLEERKRKLAEKRRSERRSQWDFDYDSD